MRRLVFCFDGSWNKLDTKSHPTNVVLVAESVLPITPNGTQQIVYYDEGVGTASDETFRGGAFGKGLVQNIREAYRFLLFNYQPEDEIFVFGFSRGAFTARSFIGFIRAVGILTVNDAAQINEAWELYEKHAVRADDDPEALLEFRSRFCPGLCTSEGEQAWRKQRGAVEAPLLRIRYCGVWDTVGSLGWQAVRATFDRSPDKHDSRHNTDLSPTVDAARHALALDERRVHFMPTLWHNVRNLNARANADHYSPDAPYQQKWFAGDHGSVGGGGPERGLSNAALAWVLRGAINQGLKVRLDGRSQLRDVRYQARAPLHNTPAEGIQFGRWLRGSASAAISFAKVKLMTADRSGPDELNDLHPSAMRRWFVPGSELPEHEDYRPATLIRVAAAIEMQRDVFVPVETKSRDQPRYVVKTGDWLSAIARDQLGDLGRSAEIFALNRDLIDHPDDIYPGDALRMPNDWQPSSPKFPTD